MKWRDVGMDVPAIIDSVMAGTSELKVCDDCKKTNQK